MVIWVRYLFSRKQIYNKRRFHPKGEDFFYSNLQPYECEAEHSTTRC